MARSWRRLSGFAKSFVINDLLAQSAEKCRFIQVGRVFPVFPPKKWFPGSE
jgi:hypothetical protein